MFAVREFIVRHGCTSDRYGILGNRMPLIEDRGQTDRMTILANPNLNSNANP